LHGALLTLKDRKRSLAIDGIYSIMGLLPYGDKVKVNYSLNPEEALLRVVETAIREGYAEPLS